VGAQPTATVKKLLKIQMGYGPVWAKTGSMVAYQGDVRFENKGAGGLGKMFGMMKPFQPPPPEGATWCTGGR